MIKKVILVTILTYSHNNFITSNTNLSLDTVFLEALEHGAINKCLSLVALGANVNISDNRNWTALHFAAFWNSYTLVKALLKHNASINSLNNQGWTPLHIAVKFSFSEIIDLLTYYGASITPLSYTESTPCTPDYMFKILNCLCQNAYSNYSHHFPCPSAPLDKKVTILQNIYTISYLDTLTTKDILDNNTYDGNFFIHRKLHQPNTLKTQIINDVLSKDNPYLSIFTLKHYHEKLNNSNEINQEHTALALCFQKINTITLTNKTNKALLLNTNDSSLECTAYRAAKKYNYKNTGNFLRKWAIATYLLSKESDFSRLPEELLSTIATY